MKNSKVTSGKLTKFLASKIVNSQSVKGGEDSEGIVVDDHTVG